MNEENTGTQSRDAMDKDFSENGGEAAEESKPAQEESEINEEESDSASSEKKINELNDKYIRLYSEFDNFRKRTARERIDLVQTAGSDIIKELLPILDDFERAIISNQKTEDPVQIRQGFELIHNKLLHNLKRKGLEEMNSRGVDFDPEIHEAVTKIPAKDKSDSGKVMDVLEKGYYLNGKVLRYAKVVVGE